MCVKTKLRPEATGWLLTCCCCCTHRGVVQHTSALITKSRACKAEKKPQTKMDQPRKPERRNRAAIRRRASPQAVWLAEGWLGLVGSCVPCARCPCTPPCVPCSPLVLHVWALQLGVLANECGFICNAANQTSHGLFALETFSLLFCILYFKHQEKKLHQSQVLHQGATVSFNARVKHFSISGHSPAPVGVDGRISVDIS